MKEPSRTFSCMIYFMLALTAVSFAVLLRHRFAHWMIGAGIGVVAILALLFLFLYIRQESYVGNRMARLIGTGDFAGAIRVGEDALRNKRDYVTVYNLAMAYAQRGQRQKAAELLPELEANAFGEKFATPEAVQQFLDHLRAAINQTPGVGS